MTLLTTSAGADAILPETHAQLITLPVESGSVAFRASTLLVVNTTDTYIPRIKTDPTAAWVAEGDEISLSDPTIDDVKVTPRKVAGITAITREMAADSSPAAQKVAGDGIARDIARKVDAAFFGNTTANGPSGLGSLSGTGTVAVTGAFANLDPFAEAISNAEQVGAQLTAFVANPADVLELAQLKEGTGSNRGLLGSDPTNASKRQIAGVELISSPDVAAGTVWGIPAARVFVVRREDVTLEVDRSVFFTSDRVAIKAVMRVGFAFPHPAAIQKITVTAA